MNEVMGVPHAGSLARSLRCCFPVLPDPLSDNAVVAQMKRLIFIAATSQVILMITAAMSQGSPQRMGPVAPDGKTEITCDLPASKQFSNTGGSDGAGLCVFASITFSARYQHCTQLEEFFTWMRKHPGGGYPEKVDRMIAKLCEEKAIPVPAYIQYSGKDPAILDLAIRTGRMPAITYGSAHMTSLVYLDSQQAAVLDNNFPGKYSWMSRDEFLRLWRSGGSGWTVILLAPPPPPIPINKLSSPRAGRLVLHPPAEPAYSWRFRGEETDRVYLYLDGVQVGGYDLVQRYYRPLLDRETGTWGERQEPPFPVPDDLLRLYYGCDKSRLPREEMWNYCGRPVPRQAALEAISSGRLDDDSMLPRLTIIGSDAERARVVNDLKSDPSLLSFRGKLLVQDYPPDHWAIVGVGIPASGHPTILLQAAPDATGRGKVLHRQDGYSGAVELAGVLRKTDPSYHPESDPDLSAPLVAVGNVPGSAILLLLSMSAVAAIMAWRRQKVVA